MTSNDQKPVAQDKFFAGLQADLDAMRHFYLGVQRGVTSGRSLYRNCIRASFAKTFEWLSCLAKSNGSGAFFLIPSLRGICEDLIVLKALDGVDHARRQSQLLNLMYLELRENISMQSAVFSRVRPFQPVLQPAKDHDAQVVKLRTQIQAFWKREGWNLQGKVTMPQIRQLAERVKIKSLYDYLYRITCDMVHFNPQVLMRSGWGEGRRVTFSIENFSKYYAAFASVYGTFLLILYFELLGDRLRPDRATSAIVASMRNRLLAEGRWPEIVTFEEMNLSVPQSQFPILEVVQRMTQQGKVTSLLALLDGSTIRDTGSGGSPAVGRRT